MATVTQIAKSARQPRGGYIRLADFGEVKYSDALEVSGDYSISSGLVGVTVDYLSRAFLGSPVEGAFGIALRGAKLVGASSVDEARGLCGQLQRAVDSARSAEGLSDDDIAHAVSLARFDAAYRAGAKALERERASSADAATAADIRTMVARTVRFFTENGPLTSTEMTFEGGYFGNIDKGDADYLTADCLWDLKTSKVPPKPHDTLQLAIYYLLALRSPKPEYRGIERLGFYNPRLNASWDIPVLELDELVLDEIQRNVLKMEPIAPARRSPSARGATVSSHDRLAWRLQ